MAKKSFIYHSLFVYRLVMNALYLGKYKNRFRPIVRVLQHLPKGSKVLELCFGDVYIAEFCKNREFHWTGVDLNGPFAKFAQRMGFNAICEDLTNLEVFPKADICIIMGSFYHFNADAETMLKKIFEASHQVIISEPVLNLASSAGPIGFFARRLAGVGKGHEAFRYNTETFSNMIEKYGLILEYTIESREYLGKDLIVKLVKHEKD